MDKGLSEGLTNANEWEARRSRGTVGVWPLTQIVCW